MFVLAFAVGCSTTVTQAEARPGCGAKEFKRSAFHKQAKRVYDGRDKATKKQTRRLKKIIRCQKRPKASLPLIRKHRKKYRQRHLYTLEYRNLTPYVCGDGLHMRFALPCYIVFRESRYDQTAKNSKSTAGGWYQFIDGTWFAYGGSNTGCYHVAACASALEQHQVASRAWAGGAGSSHWALTR